MTPLSCKDEHLGMVEFNDLGSGKYSRSCSILTGRHRLLKVVAVDDCIDLLSGVALKHSTFLNSSNPFKA